jgi:hypothetical protein
MPPLAYLPSRNQYAPKTSGGSLSLIKPISVDMTLPVLSFNDAAKERPALFPAAGLFSRSAAAVLAKLGAPFGRFVWRIHSYWIWVETLPPPLRAWEVSTLGGLEGRLLRVFIVLSRLELAGAVLLFIWEFECSIGRRI